MKTLNTIKIIVTDDSKLFRKAYRDMLLPFPIELLAEAENGKELLSILKTEMPDVVLLDLEMPVMDGNMVFNILRKEFPNLPIIILTMHYSNILIENYRERGAKGFIPKNMLEPELLYKAILKAYKGQSFFYKNPSDRIKLNGRQIEMMPLIFASEPNKIIACELGISTRAVEKQRHDLYEKVGATNMVHFFKIVFSKGLQYMSRVAHKDQVEA